MNDASVRAAAAWPDERLGRLLDELAAGGFRITPAQRVRAIGLFLELRLSGLLPRHPRRLGNMLASVLCRSAEEQTDFHRVFKHCFPAERVAAGDGGGELPVDEVRLRLEEERRAFRDEAERRHREQQALELRRQVRALMPRMVAFFAMLVLLQIALGRYLPRGKAGEATRSAGSGQPATTGGRGSPVIVQRPRPSPGADATPPVRRPEPGGSGVVGTVTRALGPVTSLFVMIPIAGIALVVASSRRLLSAYARQTRVLPRQELLHLLSRGGATADFLGNRAYRGVQPMRRQLDTLSVEIDVEETIAATVQAGGWFTPVHARRKASPEYVVLLDRLHGGDHLAHYGRALTDLLEKAGVHLTLYTFHGDPRRLTLASGQRVFHLDDLAALQRTSRLLVLSDGNGLFDQGSGRLQPWARWLSDWTQAVLLTPRDLSDWGAPEWRIESQLRVPVLPATEAGLLTAARLFDPEEPTSPLAPAQPASFLPGASRLAGFFAVAEWRWVDEIEPPAEDVDLLLERLRAELSPFALDWLRALAVYPALYWSLTLYIGSRLGDAGPNDGFARALIEIVRLPWLKHGHMPEWLRKRLILDMPPSRRTLLREILETLLLTVVSRDPKDFALELGLGPNARAKRMERQLKREEFMKDSVLIDFLTRREASPADFRLSSRVAAALGLPRIHSALRNFMGRMELEAMEQTAGELARLFGETPLDLRASSLRRVSRDTYGSGVVEIVDYRSAGNPVPLTRRLYLLSRDPNRPEAILLDQYSIALYAQRKRLTVLFGAWGMVILSILSAVIYWRYFDAMPSITTATFLLAAIVYAPFGIFWLLLMRPFRKVLTHFPVVREEGRTRVHNSRAKEGET